MTTETPEQPDTHGSDDCFGIGGWLTLYLALLLFQTGLALFDVLQGLAGSYSRLFPGGSDYFSHTRFPSLVIFVLLASATSVLLFFRGPWVRPVQLVVSSLLALAGIVGFVGLSYFGFSPDAIATLTPGELIAFYLGVIPSMILYALTLPWPLYWLVSKRVKNTYSTKPGREDVKAYDKKGFGRAWLIATQLGVLFALPHWYMRMPFAAMSVASGDTSLFYAYLWFPAAFLGVAVVSWLLNAGRFYRLANLASAIPVIIVMLVALRIG